MLAKIILFFFAPVNKICQDLHKVLNFF